MEDQLSWESVCLTSRGSQVRALYPPFYQGVRGDRPFIFDVCHADMAELADAQRSGRCMGNHVQVRILFGALSFIVVILGVFKTLM